MPYLLAFHIIFVICWFAGLFYLPRIFVYHADTQDQATKDKFKIMEHKLFYYIMNPSLVLTIITGVCLVPLYLKTPHATTLWLYIKDCLVLCLVIYHYTCWRFVKIFKHDKNTKPHKFFRFYNEIPTILLIAIVLLATVRP